MTAVARPGAASFAGWRPAHSLERRRLESYVALILGDVLMLLAGFALAIWLYFGNAASADSLLLAQLILPVYFTIALYNRAYSIEALRRPWFGIARALVALALAFAIVVFVAFYTKSSDEFSRIGFTGGFLFGGVAVAWLRLQLRDFVHWRCGPAVVNELVIDDGGPALDLPGIPLLAASAARLRPDLADPAALDRIGLVLRNVERVVVSCPAERRGDWAMIFKGANIMGEVVDEQVAALGAQGARLIGGTGLLLVSTGPLGLRARVFKRLFDLVVTIAVLALVWPVLLLTALAILLEDGAPVLFAQRRVGRGNRLFTVYKFRSMRRAAADPDGAASARRDDARVTRVGRFIRRTSIDELPQLFNVLTGEMSLVGPRPHALGSQAGDKYFWDIDRRYWQRHALKPGLTGLAQVRGLRGATAEETDLSGRLEADLEYLAGWSLWGDASILFATLRVLIHDRAF